ncbi:type II secretion system protein [Vibrio cortegadensis]|uniref:type II secretion system protein n=1 Tax=Vibrio cortegadensis TaxID=1328770 RepID=UPI00352C830C
MKKQGGFTLIELVVVIVILGILAVTAAPRFLNLQDDARNSALEGLKGAMSGAGAITYGKAAIEGQEGDTGAISAGGETLNLVYGYPKATETDLKLVVDGLDTDWKVLKGPASGAIAYGFTGYDKKCVVYKEATENAGATVTVTDTSSECK